MSVRRAQEEIDAPELREWADYYNSNPSHEDKVEHLLSTICSILHNGSNPTRKLSPEDFIPRRQKERKRQTLQEQKAMFKAFAKVHNEVIERGKRNRQPGS